MYPHRSTGPISAISRVRAHGTPHDARGLALMGGQCGTPCPDSRLFARPRRMPAPYPSADPDALQAAFCTSLSSFWWKLRNAGKKGAGQTFLPATYGIARDAGREEPPRLRIRAERLLDEAAHRWSRVRLRWVETTDWQDDHALPSLLSPTDQPDNSLSGRAAMTVTSCRLWKSCLAWTMAKARLSRRSASRRLRKGST